jgi:hypothetical protein
VFQSISLFISVTWLCFIHTVKNGDK